jgi:hypothetical protein
MQVFAILILLPHAGLFWRRERRSLVPRWLLATGPPVVLALLVAVVANSQRAQVAWIGRGTVSDAVHNFISGTAESFHALLLLLAIVFVLVVQVRKRCIDDVWAMSLGILVIPTAVLFVVSDVTTPVLVGRYVVSQLLGAALLLGAGGQLLAGVVSSRRRVQAAVAAVLVVAVLGVSFADLHATLRSTVDAGDNYPALVKALTRQARVGDGLIVQQGYSSGGFADGVAYYLGDTALLRTINQQLPKGEPTRYERVIDGTDPFSTTAAQGTPDTPNVWVVQAGSSPSPATNALVARGCRAIGDGQTQGNGELFDGIALLHFGCP